MDVFESRQGKILENFASKTTGATALVRYHATTNFLMPTHMTRTLAVSKAKTVASPSAMSGSVNGPFLVRK